MGGEYILSWRTHPVIIFLLELGTKYPRSHYRDTAGLRDDGTALSPRGFLALFCSCVLVLSRGSSQGTG